MIERCLRFQLNLNKFKSDFFFKITKKNMQINTTSVFYFGNKISFYEK